MALHYFECGVEHSGELIIVEGKHAANAVNGVRNKGNQAVLAMQGKVPNFVRKNLQNHLANNDHASQLTTILESWRDGSLTHRYNQVVILGDPDADGVHATMLLVCLIGKAVPELLRKNCLLVCRTPLFLVTTAGQEQLAYSEIDLRNLLLAKGGRNESQIQRFKGLASMSQELLHRSCVDPASRAVSVVTEAQCAAVMQRLA